MAERPQGFARRMMAQQLASDARADPFSDSRFFSNKPKRISDFSKFGEPALSGVGDALLGNTDVESAMLLPVGKKPDGGRVLAFPKLLQGIASGAVDAVQTGKNILDGDPRYSPQYGPLSDKAIDDINNIGLTIGGTALTGANLLKGSIPEGAIGIFAGKRAETFPGNAEKYTEIETVRSQQNQLLKEYDAVNYQLSSGRMALGDEATDQLAARKAALMDQMDANSDRVSRLSELEVSDVSDLEAKYAKTDEQSFFRDTEDELGKGIFKLPDNQFRFEIDDRPAKIKLAIADDADALYENITSDALEIAMRNQGGNGTGFGGFKGTLEDLLEHDELFAAYPELKNYKVTVGFNETKDYRGAFYPDSKRIEINLAQMRPLKGSVKGAPLKQDIKSILMHEVQHAVQEIEGFARGSNTKLSENVIENQIRTTNGVLAEKEAGEVTYNAARSDIIAYSGAERIKNYEQKSLLDSHQPRLLFNQANWYKYGDDIRREVTEDLGYSYNKRKSPKRELWISSAFAKLAQKERDALPGAANLADSFTMKEIKSQIGKAQRLANKNYDSYASARNARYALDKFENDPRYNDSRYKDFNVYSDTLGEVEARAVQARLDPLVKSRTLFPPAQIQEGLMDNAPPFGLQNTLRQQGGFFKD